MMDWGSVPIMPHNTGHTVYLPYLSPSAIPHLPAHPRIDAAVEALHPMPLARSLTLWAYTLVTAPGTPGRISESCHQERKFICFSTEDPTMLPLHRGGAETQPMARSQGFPLAPQLGGSLGSPSCRADHSCQKEMPQGSWGLKVPREVLPRRLLWF